MRPQYRVDPAVYGNANKAKVCAICCGKNIRMNIRQGSIKNNPAGMGGGITNSHFGDKIFKNRFTPLIWRLLRQNSALNSIFCTKKKSYPPKFSQIWTRQRIIYWGWKIQKFVLYTPLIGTFIFPLSGRTIRRHLPVTTLYFVQIVIWNTT